MPEKIDLKIFGNHLSLLPEKAIYWKEKNALLAADIHIGKTASFRAEGLPLPGGTTSADLKKLQNLVEKYSAKTLFILGDFFHSKSGRGERTLAALSEWRKQNNDTKIFLITGNHDKVFGRLPDELRIKIIEPPLVLGNLSLSHHPVSINNTFVLSGHIHPSVRLYGKGKARERVPCFLFRNDFVVLPAFGEFTGTYDILPEKEDRIFIPAGDEVFEIDKKFLQKNTG